MEIGVLLNADSAGPEELVTLARAAEEHGIGIAVIEGRSHADPWAVATWVVGVTTRLRVGVSWRLDTYDPFNPDSVVPTVADKATATLAALAPDRAVPSGARWTAVDAGVDAVTIRGEAGSTIPVVRVRDAEDIARLAPLAAAPQARSEGGGPQRSALVLAQRVPGIDYDAVPASLVEGAVEPGDPEHGAVSSTYLRAGSPGLVLRPRTVAEVADAVAFARDHTQLPLGIRSAGHGISGRSTNRDGLVISVGAMDRIEVLDEARRLVRIGPGATWKRVAHSLRPYGWALGSGDYGGVGVGGLATAGGIGCSPASTASRSTTFAQSSWSWPTARSLAPPRPRTPTCSGRCGVRGRTSGSPPRSSSRPPSSATWGGRSSPWSPTTSRSPSPLRAAGRPRTSRHHRLPRHRTTTAGGVGSVAVRRGGQPRPRRRRGTPDAVPRARAAGPPAGRDDAVLRGDGQRRRRRPRGPPGFRRARPARRSSPT